jgi:hypothetical protein
MDTAVLPYMSMDEIAQSFRTAQLEQAFERALRQCEEVYELERQRQLRVRILLLEDENDSLQDQVAENEIKLEDMELSSDDIRHQLVEVEAELQQAEIELRGRTRELESYKAEVISLHATNSDTSKVLREKLALDRELANMKPELEHLRSQVSTQSNLLSEKLALQREVSSLQVELETEKRAVQRKGGKQSAEVDTESVAKIEELKKEIAKEKREATKSKNKANQFEAQKETLENKLEAFRNKLRSTKEQLKEVQDELEQSKAAMSKPAGSMAPPKALPANSKKRPIARFDPDATIGTPGQHVAKKAKTALPGDKSEFSMTPFLSRTMSILPESPATAEEVEAAHKQADEVLTSHIDTLAAQAKSSPPKPTEKVTASKLSTVAPMTTNATKPKKAQLLQEKSNANATVPKPRLEKVTEETDQENTDGSSTLPAKEPKKQKLLGQKRTLFDGDDFPPTKMKPLGGLGLRGGGMTLNKVNLLGGKTKTLAEFSPLKKDRRAAQASFLG